MYNKLLLCLILVFFLISCEQHFPDPEIAYSFELKSAKVDEIESHLNTILGAYEFHKSTALSDSDHYIEFTKKKKMAMLFENKSHSYIMINNIIKAKCYNVSMNTNKNTLLSSKLQFAINEKLTEIYGDIKFYQNQSCKI